MFPSSARSPLFGHFSTTLLGLDTIRAFGVEETFIDQVNMYQDTHTRAWFMFIAAQAWLTYRLEILCVIFISFTSLVSPALRDRKLFIKKCCSIPSFLCELRPKLNSVPTSVIPLHRSFQLSYDAIAVVVVGQS